MLRRKVKDVFIKNQIHKSSHKQAEWGQNRRFFNPKYQPEPVGEYEMSCEGGWAQNAALIKSILTGGKIDASS